MILHKPADASPLVASDCNLYLYLISIYTATYSSRSFCNFKSIVLNSKPKYPLKTKSLNFIKFLHLGVDRISRHNQILNRKDRGNKRKNKDNNKGRRRNGCEIMNH